MELEEPTCECGDVFSEHVVGLFYQPCTICDCPDFESVAPWREDF